MKVIHIDLDGVAANFDKKMEEVAPHIYLGDGPDYDIRSKMVDEVIRSIPGFFQEIEPIEGAIESINHLFLNHEVYFLSSPVWAVPESFSDKRIWVEKHFGEKAKKRLILTHRKDLVIGDYLIDDRLRNGASDFKGEHIHFGSTRFPTWETVIDYIKTK
jgi:5'-nucleotidase